MLKLNEHIEHIENIEHIRLCKQAQQIHCKTLLMIASNRLLFLFIEEQPAKDHGEMTSNKVVSHKINKVPLLLQILGFDIFRMKKLLKIT